jgi:hypothetical protein
LRFKILIKYYDKPYVEGAREFIGLTYVIPRLKQVEEVTDEMPTNFQIEIIDSLSKYSDKELDNAIKN